MSSTRIMSSEPYTVPGKKGWTATMLTLFPEMFPGPLGHSLAGKALENGIWSLETLDIRQFSTNKHGTVDDTPYGGGPGMVMRADVLAQAVDKAQHQFDAAGKTNVRRLYMSPRGRRLDQELATELSQCDGIIVLCGRYEGVDQRVIDTRDLEEVSIGDFVLSGGEPAAMILMDAVIRLLPDVMGQPETLLEESFTSGLLEYPHYTRPEVFEGHAVPDVLKSGHHKRINDWRKEKAKELTRERRQDLWASYCRDQGLDPETGS